MVFDFPEMGLAGAVEGAPEREVEFGASRREEHELPAGASATAPIAAFQ